MNREAWGAADMLHAEAHGVREPFVFCQRDTCVGLKDALFGDWREWRPAPGGVVPPVYAATRGLRALDPEGS